MAKGGKREGAGRKKGVPNKATTEFKEFLNKLNEASFDEFMDALEKVRANDPAKYIDLRLKLMNFSHPTKKAVEQTIEHANEIKFSLVDPDKTDTNTSSSQ